MRFFFHYLALLLGLAVPLYPASAQQISIPVAFHRQEQSLSCEVAALKIALAAHNIEVSEAALISKLPFDPTPKRGGVWGDPNKGFVGNIDGRMLVTGYGVHWDPIATLGAAYTATEVIRHGSPQQLAQHIAAGTPVIIWGYYGARQLYSWQTPSGETVTAANGEHTMVVYGFDGTTASPTRFYLMDPSIGAISWTMAELMHNWSALQHMGVAVKAPRQWVRLPQDTKVWELAANNTRRWVSTWQTFVQRGGSAAAVKAIDHKKLQTYILGSPIQ
ncbi:MAG: C39 family peptidase [Candidatus Andersenbacteria bacterium]